ncbi:MAG: pyridoxal-phosphate-dependent aminotransferase family protein [Planctomycetota bacterium]|jgi:alanine-glyoxylate transaminase/serine-glyoxylate transaminase/serine-pyruvate transaminase
MSDNLSFSPTEVLLLGPGPSPVSPGVRAAGVAPLLGHLDPEFLALMDRVQSNLRRLFGTKNRFTLPISGTGSAGMETMLVNLVEPGDRMVIGINGVFGGRMAELSRRLGAEVVEVKADFGKALDPAEMAKAIDDGPTKLVAVVHAETSTGVLQPLPDIVSAAKQAGAMVLLDCVTSLGGVEVELDALGIDAAFSGTQKCLSVPPGLAPFTMSEQALKKATDRASATPSWYLDVKLLGGYWGGDRVYHHTAPVSMIYGLAAGLEEALAEGMSSRAARHSEVAQALYRGLEAMDMACLVDAEIRTPMLTSVIVPDGIDEAQVRSCLRRDHCIEIGGGLGPLKGKVWRIGLMGHGARLSSVQRLLSSLGAVLTAMGRACDVGQALTAARG